MPKPFANSAQITYSLVNGDWLLGIQTGNSTGDAGLPQMKHIKLSQLSDWVRGTYGQIWRYRGPFSASLPSDPQANDYFLATVTFTVDGVTYTKDHLYAYNASGTWDDISDILTQYASQSQVTDIDDRLTVAEEKIDAMGDGIVYKGEVATYADLIAIADPQTGWEYFVTANASFYIYNGSSWDQIDNGIVQTITDGDTAHAPSGNAVYDALAAEAAARESEDSNLKSAIQANSNRISNLEENLDPTGAYKTVNYRGTNDVPPSKAKYALVESIVGKSRGWNQMANPANNNSSIVGAGEINGITVTYDATTKKYHVQGTANASYDKSIIVYLPHIGGHKYLFYASGIATGNTASTRLYIYGSGVSSALWNGTIDTASNSGHANIYLTINNGTSVNFDFQIVERDLTLIFPEGVPSTVAECVQKCPDLLKYDAYGYSLVDTVVEGVKSVGVNIWDEEWESGGISSVDGTNILDSTALRTDFIPVGGGVEYYILTDNVSSLVYSRYYDADKNYLGYQDANGVGTITTPGGTRKTASNCAFVRFVLNALTSYNGGFQICLNSYPDKTTYHPYMTDTLSLPTSVTLRSAGSVAEVYDLETGEKTNPLGSVDLGTLAYSYQSSTQRFLCYYSLAKAPSSNYELANISCSKYLPAISADTETTNMTIGISYASYICIKDTSKTGSDLDAQGKASWLNGVYLNYELATPNAPTQLTPVINNFIEVEGGGTINTIQTQTPVIDNCLDVGYLTL